MDLNLLPKNASSLKFNKFDSHVMSLCLTLRVNLVLSLRKTSQTLKDIYNIQISHQQIANYCKTASLCVKPFVDNYDYSAGNTFTADETYIKVRGIKTYIWFIMDAARQSMICYRVSDNRIAGHCIMAMHMAFRHFKKLPKEFRPFKQMIERLNRTYKASYRKTNRFDNINGANYDLALWVAYYNFCVHISIITTLLDGADNMPGKWQLLIFLGQQTILQLQKQTTA